ncbi:MAG TPA: helix-turn-helix transcriptional regulator [Reyranella sp.]
MERESSPGRAVGRLLRDQRLARELAIDDVAARLRIRSRYIEAIEQGRFDQLPGAAYIPAFLRAYANYIGLDADKVMTAYQLSGPVPIARPVTLPADFPLVEKRAPIGLAVLTVLLVIGAGYAVWHYLPRQQMIVSEKVPPVPDRMMATPAPAPQPAVDKPSPSPAQTQEVNTPTSPAPAASTPAAPTSTASAPAPVAPAATPAAAAANEVWPAPKQETQAAAPAAPPAVVVTPPPPLVMPMPGIGQAQAAQAPAPAPAPVAQQEATAPPASRAATSPMQSDTKVYARSNSWIELRGPAGDVLTQTYVRAGESYTVPAGIAYRIIDAR